MSLCQMPEWAQALVLTLTVFPHLLTFIPPKYRDTASGVFKVLDVIAANYGHCKNKTVDEQDKVTPRPS